MYPLTAFAVLEPTAGRLRAGSPEVAESVKSETPEPEPAETRAAVSVHCQVRRGDEGREVSAQHMRARMRSVGTRVAGARSSGTRQKI